MATGIARRPFNMQARPSNEKEWAEWLLNLNLMLDDLTRAANASFASSPGSLVYDSGVLAADVTSHSIPGLDLAAHGGYEFEFRIRTIGAALCSFYVNGDTTASNYFRTLLYAANGVAPTQSYSADAQVTLNLASPSIIIRGTIHPVYNDSVNCFIATYQGAAIGSSYIWSGMVQKNSGAMANITGITLTATAANEIRAGSRFRLWRMS